MRASIARLACAIALASASLACAAADAAPDAAATPTAVASAPLQVLVMLHSPPDHARVDGHYDGAGYGDAARAWAQARVGAALARAHGFAVVTEWPLPTLGLDCVVLSLPPGAGLAASIEALQSHPEVAWAQPMNEFHAQGHADPLYPLQPAAAQWHLDELHAVATGRGVVVAVVDSGIDASHPDLAKTVAAQENFVAGQVYAGELHGTAVAGLVAARADNGIGIVGIAPDARLLALRACWEVDARRTLCNSLSLARALNYAIEHRADVINMSLSGPDDLLLGRLIDVALSRRQQVVAAVDAQAADGGFPADHPGVIAVGDSPAGATSAWTAPARDLPTTAPGGGWRMVSGTSFAAGQVAGLLAVLDQARVDGGGSAGSHLMRLPGGGIDACASLRDAVVRAGGAAASTQASASPGCGALLASTGALAAGR